LVERSHVLRNPKHPRRLVECDEGTLSGVSVVEDLKSGTRALYLDSFRAAETGPSYGYMRMLAHLPLLLHPGPERVLVIAFGTGTTAGAVSTHPGVTDLVCVEIEEAVYGVADLFAEQNRGVLGLQRTRKVVADGREFVARAGSDHFDVITLEPLMPYTPGAVHLYTKEFYDAARERLSRGGFLCQWIPIHAVGEEDFRRLIASVAASFRHVSLWYFNPSAVVVAGEAAPRVRVEDIALRGSQKAVGEDLRTALVGDAAHLLGAHVASDDGLRLALGNVPPMTDDRTVLEFRPLPNLFGRRSARYRAQNLEFLARAHAERIPWLEAEDALPAVTTALESGGALLAALAAEARSA
ncbi:MAG: spermidine synthase, partial [Planctomycetota bacterium]